MLSISKPTGLYLGPRHKLSGFDYSDIDHYYFLTRFTGYYQLTVDLSTGLSTRLYIDHPILDSLIPVCECSYAELATHYPELLI